jgi:ribonuclease J
MTLNFDKLKNKLLFVPLGGSGEIGLNVNLYHYEGKWIMVDLGCGFADDLLPGADIVVPDINFIAKLRDKLLGIIITHSHEDHIGAVQYLWDELRVPVYATPFSAAFLRLKLGELYGKNHDVEIKEYAPDMPFALGPFAIEPISLNHSSPEMQALFIKTAAGNIFHTGDWKYDHDPLLGLPNNDEKLANIGKQGVLALVGDSTNVFNEEYSGSEGDLKKSLYKLIDEATGLVVVTTFASNLARVDTVIKVAREAGKKVVVSGRSIWRVLQAATDSGYYKDLPEFVDEKDIGSYNRNDILILCTGCQGETFAATTKMANKNHQYIKLAKGDSIIFSSKIIPGNEKKIFKVFNQLVKMGIEVLTEKDHFVHVSGHPGRKELERMYKLIKPEILVPVHGELMHMHYHARFGREIGIKSALEIENGHVIAFDNETKTADTIGEVEAGQLAVDGYYLLPAQSPIMKMRRKLTQAGVVFAHIIVQNNQIVGSPIIKTPGVLDIKADSELIAEITEELYEAVQSRLKANNRRRNNLSELYQLMRGIIRKIIRREVNKEPVIECELQMI